MLIAFIADSITGVIKPALPVLLTALFGITGILSLIHALHPIKFLNESKLLQESFSNLTAFKIICRLLGAVFFAMCAFGGPKVITSGATGGTMYGLIISLFAWHVISFYLFCFLMDFGAMDFIGTLITKIMRPIFTLPGNSAIDCMASWVGNGPFGVMITKMQYEEGYYTKREAAVVASCFSIVSISFCTVVAKTLNIIPHFGAYYLSVSISTIICAIVLPRIWPLRKIQDTYKPNAPQRYDESLSGNTFGRAVNCAAAKAGEANFKHLLFRSTQTAIDFVLTIFPTMMAYGTILLIVSVYTPIIQFISMPFTWILSLFQIPEAAAAGPTMLVGFIDMYLPAAAGANIASDMTRFIIASVSIAQLIYITETGSIIMKNRDTFDLPFWKLIILFLMRTIIAIAVAVIMAFIVFK